MAHETHWIGMAEESTRAWKDQYMLRFPDGLRDRIKAVAESNKRSMNAEIVARLETSLSDPAYSFPSLGALPDGHPDAPQRLNPEQAAMLDAMFKALLSQVASSPDNPKD